MGELPGNLVIPIGHFKSHLPGIKTTQAMEIGQGGDG